MRWKKEGAERVGSGSLAQLEVRMLVIRDGLDPNREALGGREMLSQRISLVS